MLICCTHERAIVKIFGSALINLVSCMLKQSCTDTFSAGEDDGLAEVNTSSNEKLVQFIDALERVIFCNH